MKDADETTPTPLNNTHQVDEIAKLKQELEVQRRIAYAAGLFQGDVTIRTMLESLAEGVVIIDQSGIVVLVNNQTEQLFGYKKEEILGCPLSKLVPGRFQVAHDLHVQSYFEKPRIRPMGIGRELKALHKDGHEFPVEISLSHLETTGNKLAFAFVTDISLRKEAENSLKARNEELDAFAHTVAHDLRGSLTPLIGYCELLTDPEFEINGQHINEPLKAIFRISNKMASVIDELLLLSSVRKEDVNVSVLDMRSVIDNVIVRLSEEYNDFELDIEVADSLPRSFGYPPWIEEVWYNYLGNAIKYGGNPPKISIGGVVRDDGYACFWVTDNGSGLPGEKLAHIFSPYVHRNNNSDSHGLGLSIVKRIIEKLNGNVEVESIVDEGSKFIFTLPIAE